MSCRWTTAVFVVATAASCSKGGLHSSKARDAGTEAEVAPPDSAARDDVAVSVDHAPPFPGDLAGNVDHADFVAQDAPAEIARDMETDRAETRLQDAATEISHDVAGTADRADAVGARDAAVQDEPDAPVDARGAVDGQAPRGSFVPTGNMTTSRMGHTATLLSDGKVLLVGGYGRRGNVSSAELYDPTTGKFTATSAMAAGRHNHTTTRLSDGKALVVGGRDGPSDPAVVEIYDPGTGTFPEGASLSHPRSAHTATLLPDGKVFIAGGYGEDDLYFTTLDSAEIYDPATGTFEDAGRMTARRESHTATLLPGGKVLLAGGSMLGEGDQSQVLKSAELFDPGTSTFEATGSMNVARQDLVAALLPDGSVLVAGEDEDGLVGTEIFDPKIGSFSLSATMTVARRDLPVAVLPDGAILFAGGFGETGALNSVEIYDPATQVFAPAGSMAVGRYSHTATVLLDGRVLVAGGSMSTASFEYPKLVDSAELFEQP